MDHVEDQCERYDGKQVDDMAKPYGTWFQDDVLKKDYRRPAGKRFGLDYDSALGDESTAVRGIR